ncbi:MAG: DNA gyrase/topoisomerase IV subunit A, partial [Bacteroidales bacterium]|nr:DNA gyrase/topoisomerase IV subunit A [Bacteroidales bacterium]
NWFLDYASYVILERAVPDIFDGLKPVHRRILHAMKELDDGRYNKVANIIGHTMKFHPHGDASIGDALVQIGQKDLLVDTQGNWGNILTGDSSAAPRYIEARLSKFALEVVFHPKITEWKSSYDGRNKEPVFLPVKFPLLLAQGVEGIAVGLASKILPHNFIELIDASIKILKNEDFEIFPDFITGGLADFSRYNDGVRGGKVRIRSRIAQKDKKTLVITEIPFGTTTTSLIESIVTANDKRKIKIRKIDDNTAENVEIIIHLSPGVSPDTTIDALYAFTSCEVSISPNSCVSQDEKPHFLGMKEILRISTGNTLSLLKKELEVKKSELLEHLLFSSLEKIFIEKRIYRDIEECKTWQLVIKAIDKGLEPYKKNFYRSITRDDIIRLTEIKIKRISKYNSLKANEVIKGLNLDLEEVKNHLDHLIDYAINYFRQIKKKYGGGRERKTEIRSFDTIQATLVAAASQKLYVDRENGFAGTGLKKAEYVCDCSDIDDIIVFREDGSCTISKVTDKFFTGEKIAHIDVFKKNDNRTIYNMIYRDGKSGISYVKRFFVKGVTRDREYELPQGSANSKVLYFTVNPNGKAEIITIYLVPRPKLRKLLFDFDFSKLAIKGRSSKGNQITRYMIRKIKLKDEGKSTLGGVNYWFDDEVNRLFTEERGRFLGEFKAEEYLIYFLKSGKFKILKPDTKLHFEDDLLYLKKYTEKTIFTAVYNTAEFHYIKRFQTENNIDKCLDFLNEEENENLLFFSDDWFPVISLKFNNRKLKKPKNPEKIIIHEFISVKGYKAKGKRLSKFPLSKIVSEEALPYDNESIQKLLGIEEALPVKIEENESDSPIEDDGQISLTL